MIFPVPGIARYTFHTHPVWLTMPGPTSYWNHNAVAIANANNNTLRFRPVVPIAVVPKQAWHNEEPAEQTQYTAAKDKVCPYNENEKLRQKNKWVLREREKYSQKKKTKGIVLYGEMSKYKMYTHFSKGQEKETSGSRACEEGKEALKQKRWLPSFPFRRFD